MMKSKPFQASSQIVVVLFCFQEEYEKRLTTTMLIAKEEWEDKKMVEIEEAVASYKEDLKHRLKEETQREVENAIATAKETWQSDLKKMNDSLNSTLNEVNILKREIEEKENRWKIEEESLNKKIRDTEIFWKRKEEIWRKEKIKAELEKQEENRAWENKVGELEKRLADGQKSSDTQDDANSAIHRLQRELRDAEKRLTDITERNTNEKQELEIELRVLSEEKIALEDVYKRMVEGRDRDIEQAVTVAKVELRLTYHFINSKFSLTVKPAHNSEVCFLFSVIWSEFAQWGHSFRNQVSKF